MDWMVNIDSVPIGQSYYTCYAEFEEGCVEELDLTWDSHASVDDLKTAFGRMLDADYMPGWKIIGICNQSDGFVMMNEGVTS